MLRLHDYLPSGNGYKVRLLLTQLKIPFQYLERDVTKRETRTPEFLAKFPNGRIPAIEFEDGKLLFESDAIISYFADGTGFVPKDRFERAQILQWLFFEQYSHEPYIAVARFLAMYPDISDPRRSDLPRLMNLGHDALGVMNSHLEAREWLVGNSYSIADIALYAYTHVANEGGFDLSSHVAIAKWLDRVKSQPRYIPITYRPGSAAKA